MNARFNFRYFNIFRRIIAVMLVSVLLTVSIFFAFNKPLKTKADVVAGVALGAGALVVLLASYFAVAGVQVTNNGGSETYVEGFWNDIVAKYKQADADHKAMVETYFDEDGAYIGTEEDLQFVLSDQAYGYWQMGKGLNSFLEDIKSWFVSDNSLTTSQSVVLNSKSGLLINDSLHTIYSYGDYLYTLTPDFIHTISSSDLDPFYIYFDDSHFYYIYNMSFVHQPRYDKYSFTYQIYNNIDNIVVTNSSNVYNLNFPVGFVGVYNTAELSSNSLIGVAFATPNSGGQYYNLINMIQPNTPIYYSDLDGIQSMSLDGVLTDGYQDFQDALDQDLSDQSENEDAVVQVGVGPLPDVLTGDQVVSDLLDKAVTNELAPTYEGVFDDQQAATDDKETEKPFTPQYPNGFIVINGLHNFFPFCIPWDLYSVFALLNAEPEAPYFEWEMNFAGWFDSYTIEIDFSRFETVAIIFRTMIIIVFLIFLIRKTRSWIRG